MYGDEVLLLGTAVFGLMSLVIGVIFYVLKSIGVMALASNRGLQNAWLGWIPIADLYLLGQILGGEMDLFGLKVEKLEIILPAAAVGCLVLGAIPVLGQLLCIAVGIFFIVFIYRLFDMYSDNAVLFTVLSVLLGLWSIFLFVIRNNQPRIPVNTGAYGGQYNAYPQQPVDYNRNQYPTNYEQPHDPDNK